MSHKCFQKLQSLILSRLCGAAFAPSKFLAFLFEPSKNLDVLVTRFLRSPHILQWYPDRCFKDWSPRKNREQSRFRDSICDSSVNHLWRICDSSPLNRCLKHVCLHARSENNDTAETACTNSNEMDWDTCWNHIDWDTCWMMWWGTDESHAYIHTYTHACMHTHIYAGIHTNAHACIHARMHTCIHTCREILPSYIHTYTHTHIYIYIYMYVCIYIYIYVCMYTNIHVCNIYIYIYVYVYIYTYIYVPVPTQHLLNDKISHT